MDNLDGELHVLALRLMVKNFGLCHCLIREETAAGLACCEYEFPGYGGLKSSVCLLFPNLISKRFLKDEEDFEYSLESALEEGLEELEGQLGDQ